MVDVPAFSVAFVLVVIENPLTPLKVTVEAFKFIVLTFELLELKELRVTA